MKRTAQVGALIETEKITGVRPIDRAKVPPELWAAMHSAAMRKDVGQGGVYNSKLDIPLSSVAAADNPTKKRTSAIISLWGRPGDKPKSSPPVEDMAGKVNGTPCEYVGAWTPLGTDDGKYVVERDAKALPNHQENSEEREHLMETAQREGKKILQEAERLALPVEPVVVWDPAKTTIEWIRKKWNKLKKAAIRELSSIDRVALCPVCEDWKLEGETPIESFVSHLKEAHNIKATGERAGAGNISVRSPGGLLAPLYQHVEKKS